MKTFTNLRAIPLGLQPKGVLLFTLDPPRLRYPQDRIGTLMLELQAKLNAIPGVSSAATLSGGRRDFRPVLFEFSQNSCKGRRIHAGPGQLRSCE